jgi:hypothetical protein
MGDGFVSFEETLCDVMEEYIMVTETNKIEKKNYNLIQKLYYAI